MAVFFPLILFFPVVLSKPNKSDALIPLTGWFTTQVNWLKEQFKSFLYPGVCTEKIPSNKTLIKKIIKKAVFPLYTIYLPPCFVKNFFLLVISLLILKYFKTSLNYLLHFFIKKHINIYIKIHINIATTGFGLRTSSGSLHWIWLKLYLC